MRNRILSLTRSSIPYVKELLPMAKTLAGCILMQQLDYWFERHQGGFYKFLEPCPHPLYKTGSSWVEELGLSDAEFRTTFDRLGIRYRSKSEYDAAPDKFQGKFYCMYHDKRAQLTWYFRNHATLDAALDELLTVRATDTPPGDGQPGYAQQKPLVAPHSPAPTTTTGSSVPPVEASKVVTTDGTRVPSATVTHVNQVPVTRVARVTGNGDKPVPVTPPAQVPVTPPSPAIVTSARADTVTTPDAVLDPRLATLMENHLPSFMEAVEGGSGITENPKDLQTLRPQKETDDAAKSSGCGPDNLWVFPKSASEPERAALADMLVACNDECAQQILDEVEGTARANRITTGIVPLARSLARAVAAGTFTPSSGVAIRAEREAALRSAARLKEQVDPATPVPRPPMNVEGLASLPPTLRRLALASQTKDHPALPGKQ